jgi:hypothetical protein
MKNEFILLNGSIEKSSTRYTPMHMMQYLIVWVIQQHVHLDQEYI